MSDQLAILLPFYNDVPSLNRVLMDIETESTNLPPVNVFLVNDGSTDMGTGIMPGSLRIECIHLTRNLGHQKAIAIGLSYIREHAQPDIIVVMDSDGEDRVSDIRLMLDKQRSVGEKIMFASRRKRQNGAMFGVWYLLYKMAFYLLTGKKISFGNFACIPAHAAGKMVFYPELWSHFPGTIMKSGLPYSSMPLDRGRRYDGHSTMHFTSLLLHGFGAMAVFIERIITRIAVASFVLMLLSALAILAIAGIRLATDLAIPGWASTLGSSMLIVLLISFIISLMAIFIYLSTQSQHKFIPAIHYRDFILRTEKFPVHG